MENKYGIIVLLLHGVVAATIASLATFATNIKILILLFIGVLLAFIQTRYFDGCVMSKADSNIPVVKMKPNSILLNFFGLDDSYIRLEYVEVLLVGFTAVYVLAKIYLILAIQYWYDVPSYNTLIKSMHKPMYDNDYFIQYLRYIN